MSRCSCDLHVMSLQYIGINSGLTYTEPHFGMVKHQLVILSYVLLGQPKLICSLSSKPFVKKHVGGRSFFTIHYQKIPFGIVCLLC